MVLVPKPRVPYGLNNAAKFECAHRRTGQKGSEQEMVPGADHDHVEEFLVDVSQDAVAPPTRPQHDQLLPHVSFSIPATHRLQPYPGGEPPTPCQVHSANVHV